MSSYLVSSDHISAIVSFAVDCGLYFYDQKARCHVQITEANAKAVGAILFGENLKSVISKYGDRITKEERARVKAYAFKRVKRGTYSAADIMNACACLEYQSSEHASWPRSQAFGVLSMIMTVIGKTLAVPKSKVWNIA